MRRDTHIRTQAVRYMIDARRKFEGGSTVTRSLNDPTGAAIRERLVKIEGLLRGGRDAEAILLANVRGRIKLAPTALRKQTSIQTSRATIAPRNGRRLTAIRTRRICKTFNIEDISMI